MELIVGVLLLIIFMLFIRGVCSRAAFQPDNVIREGIKNKKKPKESAAAAPATASSSATAGKESSSKKTSNKKHKKKSNLADRVSKIEQSQANISGSMADISGSLAYVNESHQKIAETQSKMNSYYRDLSNNMLTQYTMYKNGFASEYATHMNNIKNSESNALYSSEKSFKNASDASNSATLAQNSYMGAKEIEKNIFGKLSANVIQNDINQPQPVIRVPDSPIDISGNRPSDNSGNQPIMPAIRVQGNRPSVDISGNIERFTTTNWFEPFSGFNGIWSSREPLAEVGNYVPLAPSRETTFPLAPSRETTFPLEGYSGIYTANNKAIFDLENEVASAINDFYTTYTAYMKKEATDSTCELGEGKCTADAVGNKANALETKINALKAVYASSNKTSDDITDASFNQIHNGLLAQSTRVSELRSSIDQTFANLSKPKSEIMRDYDASVYTGIGLSIAAVSLAYYIIRA